MKLIYAGLTLTSFVILLFSFNKGKKAKVAGNDKTRISAGNSSPAEAISDKPIETNL